MSMSSLLLLTLMAVGVVLPSPSAAVQKQIRDEDEVLGERQTSSPLPDEARTNPRAFADRLLAGRQTKPTIHVGE